MENKSIKIPKGWKWVRKNSLLKKNDRFYAKRFDGGKTSNIRYWKCTNCPGKKAVPKFHIRKLKPRSK
jgi:hypothetical protein